MNDGVHPRLGAGPKFGLEIAASGGIGRGDEVGAMASTVQIFKDNAVRIRGLEKAEAETQGRAASERRAAMESLANDFERSVNGIVRSVSTAAAGMQTTAQSMTATAPESVSYSVSRMRVPSR